MAQQWLEFFLLLMSLVNPSLLRAFLKANLGGKIQGCFSYSQKAIENQLLNQV